MLKVLVVIDRADALQTYRYVFNSQKTDSYYI